MTRIFVFPAGDNTMMFPEFGRIWHVACAVTEHGRMLAGSMSQDEQEALERTKRMAIAKAAEMVSGDTTVEVVNPDDERLHKALDEFFKRMP